MSSTAPLHPNSRKASQIKRKDLRKKKHEDNEKKRKLELNPEVQRAVFIKSKLPEGKDRYSEREVCEWLEEYLKRFDDELADIQEQHKQYPNRPKSTREDVILKVKKDEWETYTTYGLSAPDITRKLVTEKLRKWNNEHKFFHDIPTKNFKPANALPLNLQDTTTATASSLPLTMAEYFASCKAENTSEMKQ